MISLLETVDENSLLPMLKTTEFTAPVTLDGLVVLVAPVGMGAFAVTEVITNLKVEGRSGDTSEFGSVPQSPETFFLILNASAAGVSCCHCA